MQKFILLSTLIITFFCGCTVLKNGISYAGEPNFELGIEFRPHKNGRIRGIRFKNPQTGNLRVSLWDADEKKLLNTYTYNNGNPSKYNFGYFQIPVKVNKTYCLTINVREYYYHVLTFDKLPLTLPEITLTSSIYAEGIYQRYPEFRVDNVIHGLIDLDFEWEMK